MSTEVEQHPDETLALLRRQDHSAFAELVRENESLITGLCQAMGMRGADLEDATAEAFAEIFRSLPGFEARSSLSTWAYRIACRVIWRLRAERARWKHAELNDATMAGRSSAAADVVQETHRRQRVWSAVSKLEPRQAAAVELFCRRDCSIDEIAEKLGCPVNTVKTLLHRARAALRQTLDDEK